MAGDEFSDLLGQLKDRSGLSYGVLGNWWSCTGGGLSRMPGDGDDERDQDGKQSVGVASRPVGERPGVSGSAAVKSPSASPSDSPSGSPTMSASASRGGAVQDGATAPAVAANPYSRCSR